MSAGTLLDNALELKAEIDELFAEHMRRSRDVAALKERVLDLIAKLEKDWVELQELRKKLNKHLEVLGYGKVDDASN